MTLLTILIISIASAQGAKPLTEPSPKARLRVLLIVAHPDDEYDMAATVYRITTELHGAADEIIITNGESGYRYASLAERYYGVALADEPSGRKHLAKIRTEESRRAAKILGIRQQWFFAEKNIPYTQSPDSSLNGTWHTNHIVQKISEQLKNGSYDLVFVLLPESETHGEHKAATILTLEAISQLPVESRPVVLGAAASSTMNAYYSPIAPESLTQTLTPEPEFRFDRDTRFGYNDSLSYQIVVDWVIAEHKSQGLFQTKCLQDRYENFWIFNTGASGVGGKAATFFAAVLPSNSIPGAKQMTESSKTYSRN